MKFKIRAADADDVFSDIAQIPEEYRMDSKNQRLPAGTVCLLTCDGEHCYAVLRGKNDPGSAAIYLDEYLRERLKVRCGEERDISFRKANWFGQLKWLWHLTDPAYRLAARVALLSFLLGVFGLLLGCLSVVLTCVLA